MEELPTLPSLADDFGHIIHRRPRGVVRPSSVDEVVLVMERAREGSVPLVVRGSAHSVYGQSQVEDGWVVDTSKLRDVIVDGDVAVVGAGARWGDVLRATVPRGLMPPVLADYAGLTVGGTLSVGGIGASSFRYGAQTDQVHALQVVTGAGRVHWCSASRDEELFNHVLASLGQLGVITQVKLRLVEAPGHVRHYRFPYASLEGMLADLDHWAERGRFDQISAVGVMDESANWYFHIDAVIGLGQLHAAPDVGASMGRASRAPIVTDWSCLDYATRLDAEVASWASSGLLAAPHPWIDVFVPDVALAAFARSVVDTLRPEDLGTAGAMLLMYPISTAPCATPLLPIPRSTGRAYLFDVLRCVPGAAAPRIEELLRHNRRIYERALEVGGGLYPISAVPMSHSDWERHFGSAWSGFAEAKRRHDPARLLGRGCGVFPA